MQVPALVEAHLADAVRAVRDRTLMAAGVAAESIARQALDQFRRGLSRPRGQRLLQGRHDLIVRYRSKDVADFTAGMVTRLVQPVHRRRHRNDLSGAARLSVAGPRRQRLLPGPD